MNGRRVIVFGIVDHDAESILDVIGAFYPKDLIALSDDCVKEIDNKLCFAAGQKLDDRIKALLRGTEVATTEEDMESFQALLESSSGGQFEIWRKQYRRNLERRMQLNSVSNADLWIGIHELFRRVPGIEVVLANLDPYQLDAKEANILSLYFETVNEKADASRKLTYAVIPGMDIRDEVRGRSGRFLSNADRADNAEGNKPEQAKPLLEILGKYGIKALCQYDTTPEASFTAFSKRGYDAFLKISKCIETEEYAKWVCACYPNLKSEFDGFYIGAAFVAIICMEAHLDEGQETVYPRELDVVDPQIRAELESERRDFCFCNKDCRHMVILSKKNCLREII